MIAQLLNEFDCDTPHRVMALFCNIFIFVRVVRLIFYIFGINESRHALKVARRLALAFFDYKSCTLNYLGF